MEAKLWTKEFILNTLINFFIYIIYYMLMVIIASEAIHALNASMSEAGFATGIFILGTLAARLLAGRSIELYGRKRMLYAGIIFYLLTTVLYFFVHSLLILYLVRFFNGIGYGIASTATSTIVSSIIPQARRGEGINYYALSMSLAAAIGPLLGMLMQQYMNFTYIIDFCVGLLFLCLGAVTYLQVQETILSSAQKTALRKFSLDNFLEPHVYAISLVAFVMGICYSGVLGFLATYAQELNLLGAGTLFFVVYAVVITLARPVAGIMFDRKGEDFVMYPSYVCLSVGLLILSVTTESWSLLLAGVFVGLGYGTFMSNGQAICVRLSPDYRIGVAVSTYFIALDLGLGIGPYMLGAAKSTIGFGGIYAITGCVALFCAVLYYLIYARRRKANLAEEDMQWEIDVD
jgi:MFS family permease